MLPEPIPKTQPTKGENNMSTTSSAPDTTSVQSAKPTIVLVHGAWADSSSWAPVIKRLRAGGYPVYAIANPLQGLVSDTAYLSSYLATIVGPVVLVGHSYGGALITNVDASAFDIRSLVYVAGFIPTRVKRSDNLPRNPVRRFRWCPSMCPAAQKSRSTLSASTTRSPVTSTTRPRRSSRSCSALPTSRPSPKPSPTRRFVGPLLGADHPAGPGDQP